MKKILLSAVTVISFSILTQAQVKMGIKAGANINDQRIRVSQGTTYAGDNFKSYHAGVFADIQLGGHFYVQPGLNFSRKGATHLSSTGAQATKIRLSYVEVPVMVLYKANLAFGKVFAGAGASYGYAISAKGQQGSVKTNYFKNRIEDWKRGDVRMNFTAGLEFDNGFFVSVNSEKGLRDIHSFNGVSVKNRSVSASVGYLIDWTKFKRKG